MLEYYFSKTSPHTVVGLAMETAGDCLTSSMFILLEENI